MESCEHINIFPAHGVAGEKQEPLQENKSIQKQFWSGQAYLVAAWPLYLQVRIYPGSHLLLM